MGRLKAIVEGAELGAGKLAKIVEDALPLDYASRMARAKEMGFDTSRPVYHGSADKITQFDAGWSGTTTGNNPNEAFFFTDERPVARDYSRQAFNRRYQDNPEMLVEDGIVSELPEFSGYDDQYAFVEDLANKQLKTHKSYVRAENPYIKDWGGERINLEEADAIGNFIKTGYDDTGFVDMDEFYGAAAYDADDVADNLDDIKAYAVDEFGLDDVSEIEDWQLEESTRNWMDENGFEPNLPKYDSILHKNVIDDIGDESAIPHDQFVVFEPDQVRSVRATFDPAKRSSSNLLASAAPAAVGLGALMGGEEAEAGPLAKGAKRIIDERFSGPLGSGNPRKGIIPTMEGMETSITPRQMDMGSEFNLYDFEGSPYILTQSDRSAAGGELTGLHGTPINPVDLRGGRDFMFDPKSEGQVWASDPNVVKSLHKRANQLKAQYGDDPLLLPYSMAPTGIDFATMPLDAQINFAREKMSKANIKKLDSQIRKVIPEWKGVSDPSANSVFRDVKGPKRKAVADIIDKNFRDVPGGLSISEARAATTASDQYMVPEGNIKNIGRIFADDAVIPDSGHPTYIGGLAGEGVGTFGNEVNVRPFMAQQGRQLSGGPSDIRALSMNHQLSQGVITDKLLKSIYGAAAPAAVGLGALYTPEQNAALAGDLVRSGVEDYGSITPDEYPMLHQAGDFLEQYSDTPIGPMLGGTADYLRNFGTQRDNWQRYKDAVGAYMDFM